jgi:hypothetical protein
MLKTRFTAHPASVGETYGEHFLMASWFARQLFLAALACSVHAVLPFLFEKTASGILRRLHERMVVSRSRAAETATAGGPAAAA